MAHRAACGGLLALVFGLCGAALAAPAPEPPSAAGDEIGLRPDNSDRLTVPVMIGGAGPFRFIVDTGAERTVISRELAERLHLAPGSGVRVLSLGGAAAAATAIIPHFRLNGRPVGEIHAPVLDARDIGADGMLGIDSLKAQRVLFDFRRHTMAIVPVGRRTESLGDGTIVVRARSRQGRLVLTDAAANGHRLTAVVDTGSQISIGNAALRRRLLGKGAAPAGRAVTIIGVTGTTIEGEFMVLGELRIGGVTLRNLVIAFADAHSFAQLGLDRAPALLLGMNAMREFDRVSIDFASRRLRVLVPGESALPGQQLAMGAR